MVILPELVYLDLSKKPAPLLDLKSVLKRTTIKAVFFDIDDTFSGGIYNHKKINQILPQAYEGLWKLKAAGISVIPVTGRPAGWCDHIARMWPVSAIVGENGAFYEFLDETSKPNKIVKKYLETRSTRLSNQLKLKKLEKEIYKKFKNIKTASDQAYREFDLAIDFCEDVKRWPQSKVDDLIQFCEERGAIAKLSSIHVNIWFGNYNKLSCVKKYLLEEMKLSFEKAKEKIIYIGDSPNDEPFFEALPLSVGVQNVSHFLSRLKFPPKYITKEESGSGFYELVNLLTFLATK